MSRRRYVVAYDIRDDARLRRVHKTMKAFGDPMQYSVFVCDLDRMELTDMKRALMEAMNQAVDSIAIMDLGAVQTQRPPFEFIGARKALPSSGARIV